MSMSLTVFLPQFPHCSNPQAQYRLGHTGSACEALVKWSWDKKDLKDGCNTQLVHVQVIQLVRKELFRVCH